MRGYKTDKRRARPAFYSDGTCPRTSKHRLSIPRVRLIALNRISPANAPGIAACAAYRVTVVKDFIVMNLIFIQTVPAACSLSLSLPLPLPLPLSLSLSLSLCLCLCLCLFLPRRHSTNRALRANADVVCRVLREEQGRRALERSAISRRWLSVIQ